MRAGLWWRFIRKAPEVWLLNVFDLARPPAPDLLVLVTVPPARAMERIRSLGETLEPHDNEAFLGSLQEGYRQVADVLQKRRRVEVLELDGAILSPNEIVDRIEQACRRLRVETGRVAP